MKIKGFVQYVPDLFIVLGVAFYLQPQVTEFYSYKLKRLVEVPRIDWRDIGVLMILIGIDILVRRFIKNR